MRPSRHLVLVGLIAVLAPVLARADHWAPREITEKFQEIDKKLTKFDDLERSASSAERRIADLEAEVRQLRKAVAEYESTLRKVNETMRAIQSEFAKLAATRQATESIRTRDGTGGDVASVPDAAAGPQARIAGERVSREGGYTVITGTVENISEQPLTLVTVRADFLDARGNVVKSETAYTSPRIIGPGGKATFKINTRRDHRIRTHRLAVQTR